MSPTVGMVSGASPGARSSDSSSTPTAQARERSHTEGSNSIELEWDHDDGMALDAVLFSIQ